MSDEESRVENTSKDSAFASGCTNDETTCNDIVINESDCLVFQCAQCNSILGDTTTWVCANSILRSITLSSVTNKIVDDNKFITSNFGVDVGSTYSILQCESCKEEVGVKYHTTTRELDHLRSLFTLHADKLTSYQIGCADQTGDSLAECLSYPETKKMNSQILKLQTVVLSLNTRLEAVEKYLAGEEENGTESSSGIASPDSLSVEQRSLSDASNIPSHADQVHSAARHSKPELSKNSPLKYSADVVLQPDTALKKLIAVERGKKIDKHASKTTESPRKQTPGKRNRDNHTDFVDSPRGQTPGIKHRDIHTESEVSPRGQTHAMRNRDIHTNSVDSPRGQTPGKKHRDIHTESADSNRGLTPGKRNREAHADSKYDEQVTPSAKRKYRAEKSHGNVFVYNSPNTNKLHRKRKD